MWNFNTGQCIETKKINNIGPLSVNVKYYVTVLESTRHIQIWTFHPSLVEDKFPDARTKRQQSVIKTTRSQTINPYSQSLPEPSKMTDNFSWPGTTFFAGVRTTSVENKYESIVKRRKKAAEFKRTVNETPKN
eukprot:UN31457